MIPFADPRAENATIRGEILAAMTRVVDRGPYILGPEVEAFEREFSSYVGCGHGVGVGNGTDALHVALRAVGVGPGDEVITVAHTAVATATAIRQAGGRPVFVDIDPATYTMDATRLGAAITDRTMAIVPVHLYGLPADLGPIAETARDHDVALVEDCAQAHGARYRDRPVGSFGEAACFSFYPTKNLGALGDGGMITTRESDLAERCRLLRQYGWRERYVSATEGWNTRLDEVQAAVLRVKLRGLDARNEARRALAARYSRRLDGMPLGLPIEPEGRQHVYHLFVIRSTGRDALADHLRAAGIGTGVHYPLPIHRQPAFATAGGPYLPQTDRAASEVLTLPLHPTLAPQAVDLACDAIGEALAAAPAPKQT